MSPRPWASQATAEDDVELRAQWEVGVTRSVTTDSSTQYIRFNIFNWYVVSSRCLSVVLKINTANTANTQYYWPVVTMHFWWLFGHCDIDKLHHVFIQAIPRNASKSCEHCQCRAWCHCKAHQPWFSCQDENLVEWQKLTEATAGIASWGAVARPDLPWLPQALEKSEAEKEMWRRKVAVDRSWSWVHRWSLWSKATCNATW